MARPDDEAIADARSLLADLLGSYGHESGDDADKALSTLENAATLPALMGHTDAAREYGVASGNLGKIAGLPDPLYGPDHPDPRRRTGSRLYDADAIREHPRARAAA